jgi:hypothetical protein
MEPFVATVLLGLRGLDELGQDAEKWQREVLSYTTFPFRTDRRSGIG